METLPEVPLAPVPGEIYTQLGVEIEILDVYADFVIYRCAAGYLNGPPRRISRDAFVQNLRDGFLEKIR